MTKSLVFGSLNGEMSSYQTTPNSPTSAFYGSRMEEDLPLHQQEMGEGIIPLPLPPLVPDERLADASTLEHVQIPRHPANTLMFAQNAARQGTSLLTAAQSDVRDFVSDPLKDVSPFQNLSSHPMYLRNFWWGDDNEVPKITLALASEILPPLPSVPDNELKNTPLNNTLASHPHLFDIVTPIRAEISHKPPESFICLFSMLWTH